MVEDTCSFLVVDDEPGDRQILAGMLRGLFDPCTIAEASSVEEVRSLPLTETYSIVFLDFVIPQVDGLGLLRELMIRWPRTPFVMVSGQGNERIAADAIKLGALDYLRKENLDSEHLRSAVDNVRDKMELRLRLEDYIRELKGFAETLVHDIRAPIRQIRFQCNEVFDGVRNGDRTQILDNLIGIDKSCTRMNSLILSLVQHIEADDPSEMTSVDIGAVVQNCVEDLLEDITRADAQVKFEHLPRAHGDATQLRRLFQNLIRNALQFRSSSKPLISISGRVSDTGTVTYEVTDNGIGIEDAHIDDIFDAFTRLHSNEALPGRGLGLATCRKIVHRHGGKIWCSSVPKSGSTIHIELPRRVSEVPHLDGGELARLSRLMGGD